MILCVLYMRSYSIRLCEVTFDWVVLGKVIFGYIRLEYVSVLFD